LLKGLAPRPDRVTMTTTTADPHPGLPALLADERRQRVRGRVLRWGLGLAALAGLTTAGLLLFGRPAASDMVFHGEAVSRGEVTHEVSATGRLEARGTVAVGAEISGRIVSVEVDFNDHVRRGQVLARFDSAALHAQLDQAHANLQTARVALDEAALDATRTTRERRRIEPLHARGMVSDAEFDAAKDAELQAADRVKRARAQVELQRANHTLAQTNRDRAELRAPIDGVVITRAVDPGQVVAATLAAPELFVIAEDLAKMRVIAAIDEADVGQIRVGQAAHFTVDAFPEQRFAATLASCTARRR
jgi:HlyD family secretion protein